MIYKRISIRNNLRATFDIWIKLEWVKNFNQHAKNIFSSKIYV